MQTDSQSWRTRVSLPLPSRVALSSNRPPVPVVVARPGLLAVRRVAPASGAKLPKSWIAHKAGASALVMGRSSDRNWIASATCAGSMASVPSRSAMVLATRMIL